MGNCAAVCGGDDDEPELSETISENDRDPGGQSATPLTDNGKNEATTSKQSPKPKKKGGKSKWPWVEDSHVVKDVYQLFAIEKELGRGASCRVVKVHEKQTGKKYAMKEMRRDDKWNPMLFEQECYILKKLSGHPNILHYEDCYVDNKNFYVLTSLCVGGELFDKIKELRHFRERPAAEVMKVIIDAMRHCHEKNIVHRDLKPENIVFKDKDQEQLVIIDFGDAKEVEEHSKHDDFVGTAFYLAPEAIKTREGWELKRSDMWTIGVIAYVLVTGRPPFWGRENKEIIRKIVRSQVRFPSTIKLSEACKDFILSLLKKSPGDRLTAEQALQHPWITGEKFRGGKQSDEHSIGEEVLQSLATFGTANKLKQLIVKTVAANLDRKHRKEYESQFHMLSNGAETLDWETLQQFLINKGIDAEDAARRAKYVVKHVSGSHSVPIPKDDWNHSNVAKLLSADKLIERQFRKLDVDEDGMISCDDLMSIFEGASRKEIMSIIDEVDVDQDGVINFEEFRRAMQFKPAYKK